MFEQYKISNKSSAVNNEGYNPNLSKNTAPLAFDAKALGLSIASDIAKKELGSAFSAIELVQNQGNVNVAYRVTTEAAAREQLILRVQFNCIDLAQFKREKNSVALIRQTNNYTPAIIAVGLHEGHSYSIQHSVPGIMLAHYTGDAAKVWQQVGAYAAHFHQIATPGYFFELHEKPCDSGPPWRSWYANLATSAADASLVNQNFLTAAEYDRCQLVLTQLETFNFTPSLAHGNLNDTNIIVDRNNIAHIIDWGSCIGHSAIEFDLAELLLSGAKPNHIKAYLSGHGLNSNYVEEHIDLLRQLQLTRCLITAENLRSRNSPRLRNFVAAIKMLLRDL